MRHSRLRVAMCAALLVAAAACDQSRAPTLAGIAAPPGGGGSQNGQPALEISPTRVQLVVGSLYQLQTNVPLALQDQVLWRSDDPSIAAVNSVGVVAALAPGATVIRARYAFDTTRVATVTITVVGAAAGG